LLTAWQFFEAFSLLGKCLLQFQALSNVFTPVELGHELPYRA
jgi:hypothetical protein